MNPEPMLDQDLADDETRRRTRRRVLLALGVMFLIVLLGAVPVFILLGGQESRLGRRLGFGMAGPTVSMRSTTVGPIDVQRSDGLAEAGVEVKHVGTSSSSRGSLLGHSESRGFTVRISPKKEAIDTEDLTFKVIDDREQVIGEGTVKLPAKIDAGASGDGQVDVELHDDHGHPAKVIIRRKGE